MKIPKRKLGKTGVDVTILGLGGEGILRTYGYEKESVHLINRAIDLGINYLESARAYSGSESYYGSALKERRKDIFLTSKSHARNKSGALAHLRETLHHMRTDYLDLWQVHDVRNQQDIAEIFGSGGAIEAFDQSKRQGSTRFVGITGHHDPYVLRRCLELYDFDTVLIPANPAEPAYDNFLEIVAPLAHEKKMGVIGMKVYVRGVVARVPGFTSVAPYFRFALSQTIATAVIGCDTVQQLEENVHLANTFSPMADNEMKDLVNRLSPYANALLYYKPSKNGSP
ncbi:MAG: aldo/keto reductase [Desulfobacterales bacterium]